MFRMLILLLMFQSIFAQLNFSYQRDGSAEDSHTETRPALVLMGGGSDVREAFEWMIGQSRGGDFLVLRATGSSAYNPFVMGLGGAHSAATLILPNRELSSEPAVLEKIRTAEAIFLAGGDQWNYIRNWKGTALSELLQAKLDAGVPVGGTSAGLAVLGEYYFSAEADSVTSAEALADWHGPKMTIGSGFLKNEFLQSLITDSHFGRRDRMGRLLAFLAVMQCRQSVKQPRGLGIDEATAVLLDEKGMGRVVGKGNAYFVLASEGAAFCEAAKKLDLKTVKVQRVAAGESFDFVNWRGGFSYELEVNQGVVRNPQPGASFY